MSIQFEYTNDGTNATITGFTNLVGSLSSLVIPATDGNGHTVIAIGKNAFATFTNNGQPYTLDLSGVTNNFKTIGAFAFYSCSGLTELIIPNSVETIASKAFYGCSALTLLTIGSSVNYIGNEAFYSCSGLTELIIPNSTTYIGGGAFSGCIELEQLTIGNSITTISSGAFSGCNKLTQLTIGNSVAAIGNAAFYGCNLLPQLTIPDSVTTIDGSAFYECYLLAQLTIGNSVTTIGNSAFAGCNSLKQLTIGNSVTTIGNYAFSDCYELPQLTIPNSVTTIGNYAFAGCTALPQLTIPNSVTTIGDNSFENCLLLAQLTIGKAVTSIGSGAFITCNALNKLTIGNSVETIGDTAFAGCTALTQLTIPNSVTIIGSSAFYGCNIETYTLHTPLSLYDASFPDNSNYVIDLQPNTPLNIQFLNETSMSLKPGDVLPVGISFNANTLSGTPTTSGSYNFTLLGSTLNFTLNIESEPVCFLSNCDILLASGVYKNITELTLSDVVWGYFSGGPQKITRIIKDRHAVDSLVKTNLPYLIKKSAFTENIPDKDIHVSGHHRVILQREGGFVGVQAFKLNLPLAPVEEIFVDYYHVKLENPSESLIVNNLPMESHQD